ncbi:NBS-containing resistance-like protein [Artemisia annua]|uniref:NBS-containing resistance-like protein n=1 Tax=Artemisia annua TaxID=35608 RepID=A0A2U1P5B3_ARTAN|nr:NBS-containing resistance-like protein [Artemisia annua]
MPQSWKHGEVQDFDFKIWISVGKAFDGKRVANAIVEQVNPDRSRDCGEYQTALGLVRDSVNGKKFLLVLDNVWEEDQNADKGGAPGSKILITSRNEGVRKKIEASLIWNSIPYVGTEKLEGNDTSIPGVYWSEKIGYKFLVDAPPADRKSLLQANTGDWNSLNLSNYYILPPLNDGELRKAYIWGCNWIISLWDSLVICFSGDDAYLIIDFRNQLETQLTVLSSLDSLVVSFTKMTTPFLVSSTRKSRAGIYDLDSLKFTYKVLSYKLNF